MTNVQNIVLGSNNLDFLNNLSSDQYPSIVLFREFFKQHTPLQILSELNSLEVAIHREKSRKRILKYSMMTWHLRSCILMILEYSNKSHSEIDLKHLENCLTCVGQEEARYPIMIKRLILAKRVDEGFDSNYTASWALAQLCLSYKHQEWTKESKANLIEGLTTKLDDSRKLENEYQYYLNQ